MMSASLITAIVPAYNEAQRVASTVKCSQPYVDEIIVVDDASEDYTAGEAKNAGARVVRQPYNQGYIAAVKRGFAEAMGDIVVTLDADGEFPADQIPQLIEPILDGYADMVQGHRDYVPRTSERILTWLAQRKADVGDSGTGFRALRTGLARNLKLNGACICGIFSLEIIAKGGRIVEVPISLRTIDKPRQIAWFHVRQFFYLLPWLFRTRSG